MCIVYLTALAVGGATMVGSLLGFQSRKISHRFHDIVLGFSAGVMLSASILGLILPAVQYGGQYGIGWAVIGILSGASAISLIEHLVPHLNHHSGSEGGTRRLNAERNKVILFVAAIAIHNFPEGLAAGVSFGTDNISQALLIAGGIALQNIPEGMITVTPMIYAGVAPGKALLYGAATGLIEILGTIIGFHAVMIVKQLLPFALAFAGGSMLYVICSEMIPETHNHGNSRAATYSLLLGFCLMLASDLLLG